MVGELLVNTSYNIQKTILLFLSMYVPTLNHTKAVLQK